MYVNFSALQFQQDNFVEKVQEIISSENINPNCLKLELTESMVLENVELIIDKMLQLNKLGINFSMDDFGTGYSSLSCLKRLPLKQLKIDQSFVRDITTDPDDAAIVQAIISLFLTFFQPTFFPHYSHSYQYYFIVDDFIHYYKIFLIIKIIFVAVQQNMIHTKFKLNKVYFVGD